MICMICMFYLQENLYINIYIYTYYIWYVCSIHKTHLDLSSKCCKWIVVLDGSGCFHVARNFITSLTMMAMASICTSSRTTSKGSIRQRRRWVRKTWPEPVLDLCFGESKGLSRISWFRIWRMAAMVAEACQTWTLPLHSWTLGGKSVQPTASQRLACQFWHSQVGISWGNSSSKGKKPWNVGQGPPPRPENFNMIPQVQSLHRNLGYGLTIYMKSLSVIKRHWV